LNPPHIFAAHWPYAEGGSYDDIARAFNRITKYVATRKGADLTWTGSVALRDAAKDVARLKQGEGPTLVTQGSTELVHSLLAADLVDEIRTFTFPVLLGKGKRLFDESSQPRAVTLTHSAVSPQRRHRCDLCARWRGEDGHRRWRTGAVGCRVGAAREAQARRLKVRRRRQRRRLSSGTELSFITSSDSSKPAVIVQLELPLQHLRSAHDVHARANDVDERHRGGAGAAHADPC
jgi:dihydrofolate reductase